MIEKFKESRDKNNSVVAELTDLSKAFYFLKYDLLIAKLHVFGFNKKSLRVTYAYLSNRFQPTKIDSFYSEILDIIFGLPQGSILRLLFFNINIIELS